MSFAIDHKVWKTNLSTKAGPLYSFTTQPAGVVQSGICECFQLSMRGTCRIVHCRQLVLAFFFKDLEQSETEDRLLRHLGF